MLPLFSSSQCLFLLNVSSLYVASPPTYLLTFLASSFGRILCDFPTVLQRKCMLVSSCVYTFISFLNASLALGSPGTRAKQTVRRVRLWSFLEEIAGGEDSSYQTGGASPSTPVGPGHTGNQWARPRGVSLSPGQRCQSHSPGTGGPESFTTKVINSSILFPSRPGAVPRANLRAIYLFTEYLLCVFSKSIIVFL